MLLDRAFSTTLRNFSTFFLIVAAVTVPLHLAYSFAFRDVLALSEIHAAIRQLPPAQAVADVTAGDVTRADAAYLALTALEVLLVPLLWRATRRAIDLDLAGPLPSATEAWRLRPVESAPLHLPDGSVAGMVGGSVAFGAVVWLLAERIGFLVVEFLPPRWFFLGAGLVRGISVALAAPFPLVAAVLARRTRDPR